MKKEIIGLITGILVIIGICFGVYFHFEKKFALADEVKKTAADIKKVDEKVDKTNMRLDYKMLSDQYDFHDKRAWTIKERFEGKKMDKTTKETVKEHEDKKGKIKQEMKIIEKKMEKEK